MIASGDNHCAKILIALQGHLQTDKENFDNICFDQYFAAFQIQKLLEEVLLLFNTCSFYTKF